MTPEQQRQAAAIEQALRVFHPQPGTVINLRVLGVQGRRAVNGFFADPAALARRAVELDAAGAKGCYFTLNPVRTEMLSVNDERVGARAEDVLRYHWLPVDSDAQRGVKETNATDTERAASWAVLERARGILEADGMTGMVLADSGNGFHACWPLDLPNEPASQRLIKAILDGLATRCDDEAAKIDIKNHDAPRIWKQYGTQARKGPHSEDRPWRWTRLISGSPWDAETARRNTEILLGLPARWQRIEDLRRGRPDGEPMPAVERAREYVAKIAPAVQGQNGSGKTFEVAQVLVRGFALSEADAWPLLLEYSDRCEPPWSERELRHKLTDAATKSTLPLGYLLGEQPHTSSNGAAANGAATGGAMQAPKAPRPTPEPFPEPVPASALRIEEGHSWIWHGFLAPGSITLFSALWKAGKTTLMAHLLRAMETGGDFCGRQLTAGRALCITEESQTRWARRRDAMALRDHIEFIVQPFRTKPSWDRWFAFLEYLDEVARRRLYDLIIFDPLVNLWPVKDENDASQVVSALLPLRGLPALSSTMLVHHNRKGDGAEATASRGSGGLPGFVDTIMELRRFNAGDRSDRRRVITSYGRDDDTPEEIVIELTDLDGFVSSGGTKEQAKAKDVAGILYELLPSQGPGLAVEAIMDRWPEEEKPPVSVVRMALSRAVQEALVSRAGQGKRGDPYTYWLPASPEESI